MKLSIIIAVYNGINFIRECLASIEKQTFKGFELILVDDGSNDGTSEYLDKYSDRYHGFPVVVLHQSNTGLPGSRKRGVEAAKGEYIGFVDADDIILPEHFAGLLHNIERQHSDMCCCGYLEMSDKGIIKREVPAVRTVKETVITSDQAIECILKRTDIFQYVWNKLLKKSILQQILFPESNPVGEDFAITLRYLQKSEKVAICPEKTYCYRIHAGSMTQRKNVRDRITGYKMYKTILNSWPSDVSRKNLINYLYLEYMALLRDLIKTGVKSSPEENEILTFIRRYRLQYILSSCDSIKAKIFALLINTLTLSIARSFIGCCGKLKLCVKN